MIRFEGASYAYRGPYGSVPAVRGVTFEVAPGESVALLGANGSGKSTIVRMANGLLAPDAGSVQVDGIDTRDETRLRELRERVGMVFQHPDDQIVATTVEQDAAFGPENLGLPRDEIRRRVDDALAAVGLSDLARREPHLLSGGQKQRLGIAGALAMLPTYLVLDEPTAMLDPIGRSEVLGIIDRLSETGHGILHVTHDLGELAGAARVIVLEHGAIAFEGTPADLFDRADVLEKCGLELPPIARLTARLAELGRPVPRGLARPEQIVEALWL